jgi:ATP-binding cassette subfamily B protein
LVVLATRKIDPLRWIWQYMMKYKLLTVLTIFGSIIEIILYSTPVVFIGIIIDLFLTQASSDTIITYLSYLFGLVIFQALFFYFVATINEILAHRVTTDMTADLFSVLQSRPVEYHDRVAIGDIMSRATSDTRVINIGLSPAIRLIMQIFTLMVYSISIMIFLNYRLALILVITGPLYLYSIYRYAKKLLPVSAEIRERFGDLTIEVAESIRGIREIKSFVAEPYIIDRFDRSSLIHSEKVKEMGYKSAVYIPHLIIATSLGLTTSFGIILMLNGELSLPELVVFVGLISLIQWMSRNLQWIAEYSARTVASSRRLQEMIFEQIDFLEFGDQDYSGEDTTIEFSNVSFRYDEDREWALKDINITIKHNETIAIVGGPGSGKSTFSKLILRLYDPV